MSADGAKQLAAEVANLATPPEVALRIEEALQTESSGASDVADIISTDAAVSAALLRLANSAAYNRGAEVASLPRAITLLGLREVRALTLGICAMRAFDGVSNELITPRDFWRHSLVTASATRYISKAARIKGVDSLFAAGLLHDMGHLVMFSRDAERSRIALELALDGSDGLLAVPAEQEVFGFDHSAVGAALAELWELPEVLVSAIRHHHNPIVDGEVNLVAAIVHVANSLSALAELSSTDFRDAPPIEPLALEAIGLSEAEIAEGVVPVQDDVEDLLSVFSGED